MTLSPTISVIMPTYNQARFLERAICSVLDQGYEKLEFMIVDGGSVDGSQDLIQIYEDDLAWWISVNDGGPASAINKALAHATGDLVTILSSDNLLMPFALHEAAEAWKQQGRPAWMIGKALTVGADDEELSEDRWPVPQDLADYLRGDCHPLPACGSFYSADVLRDFSPLRETLQHQFIYDLHCRMLAAGFTPSEIDLPIAAVRRHRTALKNRDAMACRRERRRVTQEYLATLITTDKPRATHAA